MESDFENFFLGKNSVNCWRKIMYNMRFRIGDNIVCIKEYNTIWCMTTVFNIYKVVEVPNRIHDVSANIGIFDDKGEFMRPEWDDYITLKELRKLKLERINKI